MLLQSDDDGVYLLPALPEAWGSGSVSGLCARGGFEVAMTWANGALTGVDILSGAGKDCCLCYGDRTVVIETNEGGTYSLDTLLKLRND